MKKILKNNVPEYFAMITMFLSQLIIAWFCVKVIVLTVQALEKYIGA